MERRYRNLAIYGMCSLASPSSCGEVVYHSLSFVSPLLLVPFTQWATERHLVDGNSIVSHTVKGLFGQ